MRETQEMQETQEMRFGSLGQEDSLEEEMATHSNILAWKIPWTEELSRLQSTGSLKVVYTHTHTHTPSWVCREGRMGREGAVCAVAEGLLLIGRQHYLFSELPGNSPFPQRQ